MKQRLPLNQLIRRLLAFGDPSNCDIHLVQDDTEMMRSAHTDAKINCYNLLTMSSTNTNFLQCDDKLLLLPVKMRK